MNEFENKNGGVSGPKNGLLNKPRKAISGFVYSAAVIAALVVSLIYSLALTAAMKIGTNISTFFCRKSRILRSFRSFPFSIRRRPARTGTGKRV
mgnify:CR=1 FL=1